LAYGTRLLHVMSPVRECLFLEFPRISNKYFIDALGT